MRHADARAPSAALALSLPVLCVLALLATRGAHAANSTYTLAPSNVFVRPPLANTKLELLSSNLTVDLDAGRFYLTASTYYAGPDRTGSLPTVTLVGYLSFTLKGTVLFSFPGATSATCLQAISSPALCPYFQTLVNGPFQFGAIPAATDQPTQQLTLEADTTYVDPVTRAPLNFLGANQPLAYNCSGTCEPFGSAVPPAPVPEVINTTTIYASVIYENGSEVLNGLSSRDNNVLASRSLSAPSTYELYLNPSYFYYATYSNTSSVFTVGNGADYRVADGISTGSNAFSVGYLAGQSCLAQDTNNLGYQAGRNCTGATVNNLGPWTGQYNTGTAVNNAGFEAGRYNIGNNVNNIGQNAGSNNTAAGVNNIGPSTGQYNTGGATNNVGFQSGQYNTGSNANNIGQWAGQYNSGVNVNNFGNAAGRYNTGSNVNNAGIQAGQNNTGQDCSHNGFQAGMSNTFSYCYTFGRTASCTAANQFVIGSASFPMDLIASRNARVTGYACVGCNTSAPSNTVNGDISGTRLFQNNVQVMSSVSCTGATCSLTNGALSVTVSGGSGVTSIAGTTDQISASAATGAVTFSFPSTWAPTTSTQTFYATGPQMRMYMTGITEWGVYDVSQSANVFFYERDDGFVTFEKPIVESWTEVSVTDGGSGSGTVTCSARKCILTVSGSVNWENAGVDPRYDIFVTNSIVTPFSRIRVDFLGSPDPLPLVASPTSTPYGTGTFSISIACIARDLATCTTTTPGTMRVSVELLVNEALLKK